MRLLSVSLLAVGALTLGSGDALSASAVPSIPPDWITINAGGIFTLKAPPGSVFVQDQYTINNARGGVRGPGFEMHYVYALETNDLRCAKEGKNYVDQKIDVDGHPVSIMTASELDKSCSDADYANFVGLYDATAAPSYTRPRFYTLTIWGSVAREPYSSTLKVIYQTIHFLR